MAILSGLNIICVPANEIKLFATNMWVGREKSCNTINDILQGALLSSKDRTFTDSVSMLVQYISTAYM